MPHSQSPEHGDGRRPEASPEKSLTSRLLRLGGIVVGAAVGLSLLHEVSSTVWQSLTKPR